MFKIACAWLALVTLTACDEVPPQPKLQFGKYPDIDLETAVRVSSREERGLRIQRIVVNGHDDVPACVWPATSGASKPFVTGVINHQDIKNVHGPDLIVGLGGGFSFSGYDGNCGAPVKITVQTNFGTWDYDVAE